MKKHDYKISVGPDFATDPDLLTPGVWWHFALSDGQYRMERYYKENEYFYSIFNEEQDAIELYYKGTFITRFFREKVFIMERIIITEDEDGGERN